MFQVDIIFAASVLLGYIVWQVKLELSGAQMKKDIEKIEKRLDALETNIYERLSNIEKSLSFIEGRLKER